VDPILVDVNVPPAKAEVRFSEEKDVFNFVRDSVAERLSQAIIVPRVVSRTLQHQSRTGDVSIETSRQGQVSLFRQAGGDTTTPADFNDGQPKAREEDEDVPNSLSPSEMTDERQFVLDSNSGYTVVPRNFSKPAMNGFEHPRTLPPGDVERVMEAMVPSESIENEISRTRPVMQLRTIGQALGMYIVAQDENTLYIIDQHAAHERVLFEAFTEQMADRQRMPIPLLVPITVELTAADAQRIVMHVDDLASAGIQLEKFGGNTYIARSVPSIWDGLPQQRLLQDTIDEMLRERDVDRVTDAITRKVITKACKAAVKANEWLSMVEMQALCDSLAALDNPFSCPHGRPVMIGMSSRELAHQFKRT